MNELLACRGVSKRFGDVWANRGIDLTVRAGEVLALLGENGAGKSTLMSVLAGRYRPDEGEIAVDGEAVRFTAPSDALERGIGMVYQRFMLVERLSVAENIRLAVLTREPGVTEADVAARIDELSRRYGLAVDPRRAVGELSMGERQRVEILKLLAQDARVLIFDEPTAVLAEPEVAGLFEIFSRLKADGRGVVFITHKLEEVLAAADRIAILRRGKVIARLEPGDTPGRRELARLMVGREFVLKVDKPPCTPGEAVLRAEGLCAPAFRDVTLTLNRGEILAVVGVAGNGQAELTAALAGSGRFTAGRLTFLQKSIDARHWRAAPAHAAGAIAYVPEDRHGRGCVPAMDLVENCMLTRLRGSFWLNRARFERLTEQAVRDFDIRAPGLHARAGQLSGGNLQKLILARELGRAPDLFIAESPTQGLDVAASEDVWKALVAQRERSAVLLVTGDLREALSLADRIAVMFRGRVVETLAADDAEAVARIGLLMAGAAKPEAEAVS